MIKEEDKRVEQRRIRRMQNTEIGSCLDFFILYILVLFGSIRLHYYMRSEAKAHLSLSVSPKAQQYTRSGIDLGESGTNTF